MVLRILKATWCDRDSTSGHGIMGMHLSCMLLCMPAGSTLVCCDGGCWWDVFVGFEGFNLCVLLVEVVVTVVVMFTLWNVGGVV